MALENIIGKEKNAGYQHFLFSPQCFLANQGQIPLFETYVICHLQFFFKLYKSKPLLFGK